MRPEYGLCNGGVRSGRATNVQATMEKVWDGFVSKEANQKIFMDTDCELNLKPGGADSFAIEDFAGDGKDVPAAVS